MDLLEEAKLKYPSGTKYKTAYERGENCKIETVEIQDFTLHNPEIIWGEDGKGCLYWKGIWAEVITENYEIY